MTGKRFVRSLSARQYIPRSQTVQDTRIVEEGTVELQPVPLGREESASSARVDARGTYSNVGLSTAGALLNPPPVISPRTSPEPSGSLTVEAYHLLLVRCTRPGFS